MTDTQNLKNNMTVGVKWVSIGQGIGYIIQFLVWAILARLLTPHSFGALSAATVFSNLAIVFNELGMSSAIIQRKELSSRHTVTAFWICIILGFSFVVLAIFSSSFIAGFFKNSNITPLVILLAIKYFVDSFGIVQEAVLKRELAFRKLALIDIWTNFVYSLVAISLVLNNIGIVAVGWGYLTASLVRVSLLWVNSTFRPYFDFDWTGFKELFRYGKNILGFKILNFFAGNIDIVLIGKFLGSTTLGYYSLASSLANFPRLKLSLIVSNVAFPAFSRIQDDYRQLREGYLRIIRYAAVVNFPLLIGLMLLAPQFVYLVYSSKWESMIVPLRILCFYGIFFSLTTFVGIIYDATGHPEYSFKFCIISLVGTVVAIVVGFKYGLTGITAALSVYALMMNVLGHVLVKKIINMELTSYLKAMAPALKASGIMAAGILLLWWAQVGWLKLADIWFFTAAVIVGGFIYGLGLFVCSRETFKGMVEIGRKLFKNGT